MGFFLQVKEYVKPEKFDWLKEEAEKLGFLYVASGEFRMDVLGWICGAMPAWLCFDLLICQRLGCAHAWFCCQVLSSAPRTRLENSTSKTSWTSGCRHPLPS